MKDYKINKLFQDTEITPELISKYVSDKATFAERIAVTEAMSKYPSVCRRVLLSMKINEAFPIKMAQANPSTQTVCVLYKMHLRHIDVESLAASSKTNDCVVRCEQYVLEQRGKESEYDKLYEEAKSHEWLSDKGTPLYNIGRLLELASLSVARQFKGTLNKISEELTAGCSVIVALKAQTLADGKPVSDAKADHAVVVLEVNKDKKTVEVYDPQGSRNVTAYSFTVFKRAWKCSGNFYVSIVERGIRPYKPHPEYVAHIKLPDSILPIVDVLAENAHDIWAKGRQKAAAKKQLEGTPVNIDANSFMKPFFELTKGERKGDYLAALNTIRLIFKLGFVITGHEDSPIDYEPNKRTSDGKYVPHPIPVDDIVLPKEVEDLTEYIAENTHEEWAKLRISEGWTYAPVKDEEKMQTFDLVPYCELLDSEKEYDRKMAMNTLRLLYKYGYRIERA